MARATRKIALRHRVSVSRSEKPLRPTPATAAYRALLTDITNVTFYDDTTYLVINDDDDDDTSDRMEPSIMVDDTRKLIMLC